MEAIYHEQQEGQLCAQHCLNVLLQGSYYTAVNLASIAKALDAEESGQYVSNRPNEAASYNMDDTGFFSVQVLSRALQVWGLEFIQLNSSETRAVNARDYPTIQKAYICNLEQHWLTIRRIGNQWFNLNSLLAYPELLSDTYLSEFIAQLQLEGYSIFVVFGDFPYCAADDVLRVTPVVQTEPPPLIDDILKRGKEMPSIASGNISSYVDAQDDDLQKALQLSRESVMAEAIERRRKNPEMDVDFSFQFSNSDGDSDMDLAIKLSEASFEEEIKKEQKDVATGISRSSTASTSKKESLIPRDKFQQQGDKRVSGSPPSIHSPRASTSKSVPMETSSNAATDGQKLGGSNKADEITPDMHDIRLRRIAFLEKQIQEQKKDKP